MGNTVRPVKHKNGGLLLRITRKVFYDLAIWMVALGLGIGTTFPFFVMALGVPSRVALRPTFFAAAMGAAILGSIINFTLARVIVGVRLTVLANSMNQVEQNLSAATFKADPSVRMPDNCTIPVDSEDEIGAGALAFNRLVESLSVLMATQAAVRSFSEMLSNELQIQGLAENALYHLFENTGATGGLILYESGGELVAGASHGLRNPDSVAASDHVMVSMRTGQRQVISIPADVEVEGVVTDFRPKEILIDPITYKGVPLGVAVLATGLTFDKNHLALVDLLLQGLGLALKNALAHDRLQRLVALDPLTGVYNRRFGLERLHEEFARATREGSLLGVMMLDIDHFKQTNDIYGHLVGDRVLKSICAIARSSLREGDVLFRFGGEEFVGVLPAASADDLRIVGERLRKAVEDNVLTDGARTVSVTVSIGGAAYPNENVGGQDALMRLVDEALYRAKDSGRNRVEIL